MLTIETVAEIKEDGTLTAHAPASAPRGKRHVVIVIEDGEAGAQVFAKRRKLPDLAEFRASQGGTPYPGNSVVDLREEERS
ncbi:MAG TPA: hypothetical protein VEW48_02055 [Thermoanaerobaculia bacterium]|nr:hypothetical protein [Thermoanaerobaculia bacterium]